MSTSRIEIAPNDLKLYLVSPEGHAECSSVVIATGKSEAIRLALSSPFILEKAEIGIKIIAVSLTDTFRSQGYTVLIAKEDVFH